MVKSFLENRYLQLNLPSTWCVMEEGEKGLLGRLCGSSFVVLTPLHPGFGVAVLQGLPQCERNAVPDWSWVVSRRGKGWETRVSLAFSLLPSSWFSQHLLHPALHWGTVWHRLCKSWSRSPSTVQVTNTPGAVPETDCSSGSGSTCRCFNQFEKDTRCLNIAKQLDAFPFLDCFHTSQQEFRPEVENDMSIPPTQTPFSTWLRWQNLAWQRVPSFCFFVYTWHLWRWFPHL